MRTYHLLAVGLSALAVLISAPAVSASAASSSPTCKEKDAVGTYFSAGGKATIKLAPELLGLLNEIKPEFASIAPVTVTPDFSDISMPIGSKFDKLGASGEILYPGGFEIKEPKSGHSMVVNCFWLKTSPSALYTSTSIDGGPPQVIKFATFKVVDGIKGIKPIPSKEGQVTIGWVPFYLTPETAELFNRLIGTNVKGGMLLGYLEGRFDFLDAQALTQTMIKTVTNPFELATLFAAVPGLATMAAGLAPSLATGGLPSRVR